MYTHAYGHNTHVYSQWSVDQASELRSMVARKEAAVDRLLGDLNEEKQARIKLEQSTQAQASDPLLPSVTPFSLCDTPSTIF